MDQRYQNQQRNHRQQQEQDHRWDARNASAPCSASSLISPTHQHQKQQRQSQQKPQQPQPTNGQSSRPQKGRDQRNIMVPTTGPEPSSRVAPGERHPQPSCQHSDPSPGDRKVEPLIVFDWDDTILTSSWIQLNELLQASSYDNLPLEVRRDLAQLERSVVKCLENARRLGTVIIITNAESGWVELSAARFFVDVLALLEGVPVISARSLFEAQFPGSPLCWKSAAFAYMMHDHFLDRPVWMQKKVVSIGDSNEEKVAMRIASGQHSTMAAKAIKFITGPDPEALSCQLDFVTQHLASVLSSDSDVNIVLDASMIHGSYSLPLHSRGVYEDQSHQYRQEPPAAAVSYSPSTTAPTSTSTSISSTGSVSVASSSYSSYGGSAGSSCAAATGTPSSLLQASDTGDTARSSELSSTSSSSSSSSSAVSRLKATPPGGPDCKDDASSAIVGRNNCGGSNAATMTMTTTATATATTTATTTAGAAACCSSRCRGSSAPASPRQPALKRCGSSTPIPIPTTVGHGHGHGHGQGYGKGRDRCAFGGRGGEGGGDCVQPFPPSKVEVDAPLSSHPSALCRQLPEVAAVNAVEPLSLSPPPPSCNGNGIGDVMAVSSEPESVSASASASVPASSSSSSSEPVNPSVSALDGGRACAGSGGGAGAEGGGPTSGYGGGYPCPVDGGGEDGVAAMVDVGLTVRSKVLVGDGDGQGGGGVLLSGSGGRVGGWASSEVATGVMVGAVDVAAPKA